MTEDTLSVTSDQASALPGVEAAAPDGMETLMTTLAGTADVPDIKAPMPWDIVPLQYLIAGLVVLAVVSVASGAVMRALPGGRRRSWLPLRWRVQLGAHAGPGFAGDWELWRNLGLPPARRLARHTRPSLSWWDRHKPGGWRAYATYIGRAHGWVVRRHAYAGTESVMLTFAGPRQGKSAAAADRIIDHDGPVCAVSLRDDLVKHTIRVRGLKGPAHVLNPQGVGGAHGYGTNTGCNPIPGCEDTTVAARRAREMVNASDDQGLDNADFWRAQSSAILSGYLHAAALAGYGMADVYEWSAGEDDTPLWVLRRSPGANPADRKNVQNFLEKMADRTKSSVVTTLSVGTLAFMRDPAVAEILSADSGLPPFDFEAFLHSRDTLYLISDGAEALTRPLFAVFLAELAYTAKRVSDASRTRLDPPLSMELDEIANTAPIPVDKWASWMGGAGIRMSIYSQSWTQLVDRYGPMAEALWSCADIKLVHGGTTEMALLERVHKLAGTTTVRGRDRKTYDVDGKERRERTEKEVDVLPVHDLKLPKFSAVVLAAGIPPTVVRTARVWRRWDVKRLAGAPLPAGVGAPVARTVPAVDQRLRDRIDRHTEVADPMPAQQQEAIRNVARGLPAQPVPTEQVETQPMPSMKETTPVERPKREKAEPWELPPMRKPRSDSGPPLRSTRSTPQPPQDYTPPWKGSPMPWDLPAKNNED